MGFNHVKKWGPKSVDLAAFISKMEVGEWKTIISETIYMEKPYQHNTWSFNNGHSEHLCGIYHLK